MNCDSSLEWMLDAEPAELDVNGAGALARHLRRCPRCAVVARQLLHDSVAIARAAATMERTDFATIVAAQRPRRRVVLGAVAASLAVGLVAMLILDRSWDAQRAADGADGAARGHIVQAPSPSPVHAGGEFPDAGDAVVHDARPLRGVSGLRRLDASLLETVPAARVEAVAFAPTAIVPTAITAQPVVIASTDSIRVPLIAIARDGRVHVGETTGHQEGRRFDLLRSRDSTITIVWFTESISR